MQVKYIYLELWRIVKFVQQFGVRLELMSHFAHIGVGICFLENSLFELVVIYGILMLCM